MRRLVSFLFGQPLASWEDQKEKVSWNGGVPIFGLDALSSAAYGPEAALTILIPLGAAGLRYSLPLSICIVALLSIVYFSYRQTIAAYPQGGGSYTVASENLGVGAGLLAASALMIDYILNVAVGISAGVGALVSAAPGLQPHTLAMCLGILVLLTLVNLRGPRETGFIFMAPTYMFIACLGGGIAWGVGKAIISGGHPIAVAAPATLSQATDGVSLWLILKAFASGCTALTGVEAVSNGTQAFREDVVRNARRTLSIIIGVLIFLLLGIGYLVQAYGIGATRPGGPGYQSVLSQLFAAVAGRGAFYYVAIGTVLVVVALSANTSFADFPRLCRAVAVNRFLPFGFTIQGRRLVYSQGIYVLSALSAVLLIVFGGITDRLIPLFAVGAFMAFTLSQAGMVAHWRKQHQPNRPGVVVNAIGAAATGFTVLVVIAAKFTEGAWITLIMIPGLLLLMTSVGRHYRRVADEISSKESLNFDHLEKPLALVPIDSWNRIAQKAIRFAMTITPDVRAVHIQPEDGNDELAQHWDEWVKKPAEARNMKPPELVVLKSPYRAIVSPIVNYALEQKNQNPDRKVAVVICELIEKRWYQYLLHNQRGEAVSTLLILNGDQRIVVIKVPWYLGI